MLSVNIITIGKLKEDYLRAGVAEFSKRLKGYCNLTVTELNEYKTTDPSPAEIVKCLDKEGEYILSSLQNGFTMSLCVEGGQLSSPGLADKIRDVMQTGSRLNLIIGGSFGLSDRVKQKSDVLLSLSAMTFPHQLTRLILLEQLYRAFTIIDNGKYHK